MKNIAVKLIPNHYTLNKFQHQRQVLVYHWLIVSCSGKKILACICKSGINSIDKCISPPDPSPRPQCFVHQTFPPSGQHSWIRH